MEFGGLKSASYRVRNGKEVGEALKMRTTEVPMVGAVVFEKVVP